MSTMPNPAPCILCRLATRGRGVFAPQAPSDFGAKLITYPICDRHPPTPETFGVIEDVLLRRVAAKRN